MERTVISFDYLRDARPEWIERLRSARLPRQLHASARALLAVAVVIVTTFGIDTWRLHLALSMERAAEARFDRTKAALAARQLAWQQLDALIAQDRRLGEIRRSGSVMAARLARTGNLLPTGTWLASMSATAGVSLEGSATNLAAVGSALERMIGDGESPELRRLVSGGKGSSLDFAIDVSSAP
jgi:hypothetical protein